MTGPAQSFMSRVIRASSLVADGWVWSWRGDEGESRGRRPSPGRTTMNPPGPFEVTLAAARVGHEAALERLYREHASLVLGYARANGARDPEDLTQDVFVAMVVGLQSFEGDAASFRSWLLTIAHRRLIDDLRRRGRRPVADDGEEVLVGLAGAGATDDEGLARLQARGVLDVIDSLTPDQRSVLLLRVLADLPVREIAEIVDKPVSAVKALLRRAVVSVSRRLAEQSVLTGGDPSSTPFGEGRHG
jgi:RNA polymerase sigma factor (sigma-70 family)